MERRPRRRGRPSLFALALLATPRAWRAGMSSRSAPRAAESLFSQGPPPPSWQPPCSPAGQRPSPALDLRLPPGRVPAMPALTPGLGAVLVAAGTAALAALASGAPRGTTGLRPAFAHPRSRGAARRVACSGTCRLGPSGSTMLGARRRHGRGRLRRRRPPAPRRTNAARSAAAKTPPSRLQRTGMLASPCGRCWGALFGLAFNFFTMGLTFWPSTAGVATGEGVPRQARGLRHRALPSSALAHLARNRMVRQPATARTRELGRPARARHAPRGHGHRAGQPLHRLRRWPASPLHRSEPRCPMPASPRSTSWGSPPPRAWRRVTARPRPPRARVDAPRLRGQHGRGHGPLPAAGAGRPAGVAMRADAVPGAPCSSPAPARPTACRPSARTAPSSGAERACGRIAERYALSPRETEILAFLAHGRGVPLHVAEKLCISPETVRTHTKRIYDKCGVHAKEDLLDLVEELS